MRENCQGPLLMYTVSQINGQSKKFAGNHGNHKRSVSSIQLGLHTTLSFEPDFHGNKKKYISFPKNSGSNVVWMQLNFYDLWFQTFLAIYIYLLYKILEK